MSATPTILATDARALPLRVLLVSTMYPGDHAPWRGAFIRNMVDGLARRPDVALQVWAPPGPLPANVSSVASAADAAWLASVVDAGGISHLMRSGGVRAVTAPFRMLRLLASAYRRAREVDLYHVNWLQCALALPNDGKPALVTVLGNDLKLLALPFMRSALRRTLRCRRTVLCPNADWMIAPLERAFGDVAAIRPVSFGIDPVWYAISHPIPVQPHRWLVVSRLTHDKLGPLFEWGAGLFAGGARELHLLGPMEQQISIPDWVHYHGPIAPSQLASSWFPQATGLLTLSQHAEGRPQVMLEAMAAALPIVASRMPAHASIVDDGVTGLLCDDPLSFQAAILRVEDRGTAKQLGTNARDRVAREMGTWDDCAGRYHALYDTLMGDRNE